MTWAFGLRLISQPARYCDAADVFRARASARHGIEERGQSYFRLSAYNEINEGKGAQGRHIYDRGLRATHDNGCLRMRPADASGDTQGQRVGAANGAKPKHVEGRGFEMLDDVGSEVALIPLVRARSSNTRSRACSGRGCEVQMPCSKSTPARDSMPSGACSGDQAQRLGLG